MGGILGVIEPPVMRGSLGSMHTFFGQNSAIFCPIGLNLFGNSGDYYLTIGDKNS